MITRTRRKHLRFDQPFFLRVIDTTMPAGIYAVDTDEELIEGLSYFAYLRTATWIHVPAVTAKSGCSQMVLVQPAEVEAGYEVAEHTV